MTRLFLLLLLLHHHHLHHHHLVAIIAICIIGWWCIDNKRSINNINGKNRNHSREKYPVEFLRFSLSILSSSYSLAIDASCSCMFMFRATTVSYFRSVVFVVYRVKVRPLPPRSPVIPCTMVPVWKFRKTRRIDEWRVIRDGRPVHY